jgi:hypothetical protein
MTVKTHVKFQKVGLFIHKFNLIFSLCIIALKTIQNIPVDTLLWGIAAVSAFFLYTGLSLFEKTKELYNVDDNGDEIVKDIKNV